jgi:hypothetical protein
LTGEQRSTLSGRQSRDPFELNLILAFHLRHGRCEGDVLWLRRERRLRGSRLRRIKVCLSVVARAKMLHIGARHAHHRPHPGRPQDDEQSESLW